MGEPTGRNERERMSQNFRSWLHRLVRAHGYHGAASVICEIADRKIGRAAGMDRPSPIFLNTQIRIGQPSDSAVLLLIRDDHLLKVTHQGAKLATHESCVAEHSLEFIIGICVAV